MRRWRLSTVHSRFQWTTYSDSVATVNFEEIEATVRSWLSSPWVSKPIKRLRFPFFRFLLSTVFCKLCAWEHHRERLWLTVVIVHRAVLICSRSMKYQGLHHMSVTNLMATFCFLRNTEWMRWQPTLAGPVYKSSCVVYTPALNARRMSYGVLICWPW